MSRLDPPKEGDVKTPARLMMWLERARQKINEVAASSPVWGGITGSLPDQSDLQVALNAKQPLDADLTAIAAIATTGSWLKRTAANVWSLVTPTASDVGADPAGTGATEAAAAVAAHVAAPDPHTQYTTAAELSTGVTAGIAAHVADSDPHTQYQRESEKNSAGGYAGLDGSSKLAGAQQTYGSSANTACEGNDSRLSNARAPTAHATSHQPGGTDAMAVDAAAATGSLRTLGTGAAQACAGNDSRLSDSRAPTGTAGGELAGTYPNPTLRYPVMQPYAPGSFTIPTGYGSVMAGPLILAAGETAVLQGNAVMVIL